MAEVTAVDKAFLERAEKIWGQSSFTSSFRHGYKGMSSNNCYNYQCYGSVGVNKLGLTDLLVYLPRNKEADAYLNFLFNSKLVGESFATKSAEEAEETGIRFNLETPMNLLKGAMIMMRASCEHRITVLRTYNKLKELGYSDEESFYYGHIFRHSDNLRQHSCTNHGIEVHANMSLQDIVDGKKYLLSKPASQDSGINDLHSKVMYRQNEGIYKKTLYRYAGPVEAAFVPEDRWNYNFPAWNNALEKTKIMKEVKGGFGYIHFEYPDSDEGLNEVISWHKENYT